VRSRRARDIDRANGARDRAPVYTRGARHAPARGVPYTPHPRARCEERGGSNDSQCHLKRHRMHVRARNARASFRPESGTATPARDPRSH
jgi:hypothetical protein